MSRNNFPMSNNVPKYKLFTLTPVVSLILCWWGIFLLAFFFSAFLLSILLSAAVISFCKSCVFFSLSFFLSSIFFNSAIKCSSSSTYKFNFLSDSTLLTLYSMKTPFHTFEILCSSLTVVSLSKALYPHGLVLVITQETLLQCP